MSAQAEKEKKMPRSWTVAEEPKEVYRNWGCTVEEQKFVNPATGKVELFVFIQQKRWSVVLAVTKDKQVLVNREWYQGAGEVVVGLQAGTGSFLTNDTAEDAQEVMIRELLEETGYEAGRIIPLGYSWMAARKSHTRPEHFLALDCEKVGEPRLDPGEKIDVQLVPIAQWLQWCQDGTVREPSAITTTMRALPHLGVKLTIG